MSTFAIDGLVSGLDTSTIISQLMSLEKAPQDRLRVQLSTQTSVISAYQSVSARLKSLETAATALAEATTWSARTATVSGSSVTASAGADAVVGTTTVTVTSPATAATWTTGASYGLDDVVFDANTEVPPRPLTITRTDGTSVSLYPPTGTLRDVMTTINEASDAGVRAIAVKTGVDEYRLQIVATDTGGPVNGVHPSISNLTISGSDALTYAAGADAVYTINGIPATSASNTVEDAVPGLTLTLVQAGSSTVSVTEDASSIADKIEALVKAANAALGEVAGQTVRDTASTRGPLASDSAIRSLSGRLLQAVSDAVGSDSAAFYGLETTSEGDLEFDRDAFLEAYEADPVAARAVLSPESGDGVAQRLLDIVDSAVDETTGSITLSIQGRESTQDDLQAQIDSWDRRLELRQTTLERQFTNLEVALQKLQSQQSWLSGQLQGLPSWSSGS